MIKQTYLFFLLILFGYLPIGSVYGDYKKEDCFSCEIKINSITSKTPLQGKWLFTRTDNPENKNPDAKLGKDWVLVQTPGGWKKAYNDGKVFKVGWYRGNLNFSKDLIGKKIRLLFDTYMGAAQVFLDGKMIYERGTRDSVKRYFSVQPIPISFTVTKEKHVLTFRVNTILMTGIYQMPFHLSEFKKYDLGLSLLLFYGGNFKSIAGFILLISSIFFLAVYVRTKNDFYFIPGISGILIFPFFLFANDFTQSFLNPEFTVVLHYLGLPGMMYCHFKFGEIFYPKAVPKLRKAWTIMPIFFAVIFFFLSIKFNLKLFQVARSLTFVSALATAIVVLSMMIVATKNKVKGAKIFLVGETVLCIFVLHDILNAVGVIQSTLMIHSGIIVSTFSIMIVAANNYTDTYIENQTLLAELKDYAENLEEKVKLATAHIEEEKQKVANLLNNMKQAIFSIDAKLNIVAPVSAFSNEVFEKEIVGSQIFETLYKDIDPKSEEYSQVFTSMGAVFNNPSELQYDLMCDYFPPRLKYITAQKSQGEEEEEEEQYKILSINYTPMWNDDEELEQLMLVIEDITEKEKLAHELEEQKKTSEKNITIIKEMAKADLDDITHFLKDAPKLVTNTIGLLRKKTTDPEELTEMFRNLHTLKGNSRIFNFNSISGLTHQAESDVTTIRENNQEGKEIDHEVYTHLMGKLYDIIGEISEYGALAKKVFRIENEFEKKLINDIQDFTSKIDSQINNLITKNELDFMADKPDHVRKEAFDSVKERTITPETIDILKRSAHSLKGSLRSIKKSEATDLVHKFENSFHLFENLNDASLEVFYRDFINNYIEIKDLVKSIYMNSDLNKPSSQSIQDWKELFLTFYQFSLEEKTNKGHKTETRESLKNSIQRLNLKFLTTTLKELEELPDAHENRNILMGEIWRYISFISKINFSKVSDELREEWIPHLMNIPDSPEEAQTLFKEKLKNSKNVLIESLANISRENQSPNYFFQLAQFYMHLQPDDAKAAFFLKKSDTINIKKIGKTLKNTHVVTDLPFQLSKMAQEGDSLALSLSQIIKEGGQHNYLKTIDINQVVQSFLLNEKGGGKFQVKEMDTLNIISKNYHRLQEAIDKGSNFEDVQKAFEKLMDIPLVNSLSKFEAMVLEISLKLNKRVDFEIGGEEITMNKDSYSILQDAFVHILRNSIDHGIENPDDRKKNGKRPAGNITIQCNELGNDRIEISIKDDGNGINVDRVAEKAIENGIITLDKKDTMDPSEIIDLIFLPNFSQKSEVDELSGRGVGMDIVKKNIESLGGEVKIITKVGKGTEFILTQIKTG